MLAESALRDTAHFRRSADDGLVVFGRRIYFEGPEIITGSWNEYREKLRGRQNPLDRGARQRHLTAFWVAVGCVAADGWASSMRRR
jgi:hypothetical protein